MTWVVHQQQTPADGIRSSFERRLEAQRAEERRRIHLRQEALQLQREREQRLKEEEQERQRHADKQEQRWASRSAGLSCCHGHLLTCDVVSGRGPTPTSFPKRVVTLTKVRQQRSVQLHFKHTPPSLWRSSEGRQKPVFFSTAESASC